MKAHLLVPPRPDHDAPPPGAASLAALGERGPVAVPGWWLPTLTLWQRDMVRFLRERHRVVTALATPIVFWVLLGSGLSRSFSHTLATGTETLASGTASLSYLEYFFPGTVVLILLFTAIFSTISVIEDRREGFLQGVLASPAPRLSIVLGKVLGGASIAAAQGALFLLVWPLVSPWPGWGAEIAAMARAGAVMVVLAVGLTALGLCVAWPMNSTAGFHAVMNLFLMPMWFLSGAVFPLRPDTPLWLKTVMYVNPLTYGQTAFAAALWGGRAGTGAAVSPRAAELVTLLFALGVVLLATAMVSRSRKDGLA